MGGIVDILAVASQFGAYREIFPGEYAGPCPMCGGAMRFRIWPATGNCACTCCETRGDHNTASAVFGGAQPDPDPAPTSRQYLTATGRTMTVAYDRETFLALADSGIGAFTPKEIDMVAAADVSVEVDELLLDIKEAFPGAWLKQIERIEEVRA